MYDVFNNKLFVITEIQVDLLQKNPAKLNRAQFIYMCFFYYSGT